MFSPFPLRSLFGQNEMGDGWLYWLLIAAFTLSNTLVLRHCLSIAIPQIQGLLIGGVILALSIFPQVLNWKIDYTVTTAQLLRENILVSTIFQAQQPIGLYSHRGHAAFVLAAVVILAIVAWQQRWISDRKFIISLVLIIPALLLTQTRAVAISPANSNCLPVGKKIL